MKEFNDARIFGRSMHDMHPLIFEELIIEWINDVNWSNWDIENKNSVTVFHDLLQILNDNEFY